MYSKRFRADTKLQQKAEAHGWPTPLRATTCLQVEAMRPPQHKPRLDETGLLRDPAPPPRQCPLPHPDDGSLLPLDPETHFREKIRDILRH